MESFKRYWIAGFSAAVVLFAAAIWLGGLNQDEGWYLYAANLLSEGRMLYRDFFYTQGPLMPMVYTPFKFTWDVGGVLGARIFTAFIGAAGVFVAVRLAGQVVPPGASALARVLAFFLLACNLYHVYYISIPKTYALAALLVALGFYFFARALKVEHGLKSARLFASAGFFLALAAGTRISLGLLLPVCGLVLMAGWKTLRFSFVHFAAGGFVGLALVYGPFVFDAEAFHGLCEAQRYHAARGGFSPVFVVGSLSRLVRWYAPAFLFLGLAVFSGAFRLAGGESRTGRSHLALIAMALGFAAVFFLQMLAPFPYEDYQVPVILLLAVLAAAGVAMLSSSAKGTVAPGVACLLALGLSFSMSFGSPLLEKWTTDGQDRLWTIVKKGSEISVLRQAAREIERLDPGGETLFTQDLYLAIETGRKVPKGLEMGPFSILSDSQWRSLIADAGCKVAALSGYSFAIDPPGCGERDIATQMEYWRLVKERYGIVRKIDSFGQNSTPLLLLKRNGAGDRPSGGGMP